VKEEEEEEEEDTGCGGGGENVVVVVVVLPSLLVANKALKAKTWSKHRPRQLLTAASSGRMKQCNAMDLM